MNELKIKIENCYGIKKLESIFDFSGDKTSHIIYAPNGVMKTSFANVFRDYSESLDSKDLINPHFTSIREIVDADGKEIKKESVFVIRSYEQTYKSDKMSTLLVKEDLRKRYDDIHKQIDLEKDKLIQVLKIGSGIKKGIEEEISNAFVGDSKSFFIALERLEKEILGDDHPVFGKILYSAIFDEKVVSFLETGDFKKQIRKYIEKYDELLSASTFLKKGFNHYNASTIHKSLKDHGFFKAEHTINLNNQGEKIEISDEKDLLKVIQGEKEKILNNPELKMIFEEIDKKISNEQLRAFREYLFENKEILPALEDLKKFKQTLWIDYLKNNRVIYQSLLLEYKKAQKELNEIVEKAKKEKTEWENVLEIFNRRFDVPYKLAIKNKDDAILKDEVPSIHYYFKGKADSVDEGLLLRVLSRGEIRALYLLNIIFEIESRKKQGVKTFFIIDDIADSFDYKNKYAIIEYLKEIAEYKDFCSIILTHNFDFFRTVQDRIMITSKYTSSYMAVKEQDQISLVQLKYKYISNPFKNWKGDLANKVKLIASVTFARNIAEYTGDEDNFNKLTSILHMKSDTESITIKDIEDIYKTIFKDLSNLVIEEPNKKILELIFELSEDLYNRQAEIGLSLENKVVLSMAIRLYAESYMISRINDSSFVAGLKSDQTGKLFGRFKNDFANDYSSIEVLEKVNLMTPENIHLNSFMYEPILDISEYHLKQLYFEVRCLIEPQCITETQVAVGIVS